MPLSSYSQNIISCFEYQLLTPHDFRFSSDFTWLLAQVESKKMPCFTPTLVDTNIALKVGHYLLVVRLPSGMVLEVLPKIDKVHTDYNNHSDPYDKSDGNAHNSVDKSLNNRVQKLQNTRTWVARMLNDIFSFHGAFKPLPFSADHQISSNTHKPVQQTWLYPVIQAWIGAVMKFEPIKNYQSLQHNHPTAQGKLLIKEQLKYNSLKPHYRYTQQQNFLHDPLWQRFFYSVMYKLTELGIRYPEALAHKIRGVSYEENSRVSSIQSVLPMTSHECMLNVEQLSNILVTSNQYDKHNTECGQLLLTLGRLILQLDNMTVASNPVSGKELAPAIIIDMNVAFEKWVTYRLQQRYQQLSSQTKHLWLTERESPQQPSSFPPNESLTKLLQRYIQPDVLIYDDNKQVDIVIDIKYKHIDSPKQVASSDLYQIVTYLTHYNAKQAWLVFPKSKTFQQSHQFFFKNDVCLDGCYIKILPFDVENGKIIL